MKVRRAQEADLDAILRIEAASDGAAHWRREDYASMLARTSDWLMVVEEEAEKSVGFLVARMAADEAEILNLAVDPAWRRHGAGSVLVDEAARLALERGAKRLYLEVRVSNEAARAFYRANEFRELSRRRDYYDHPREDAAVLVRELLPPAQK